MEGFDFEFDPRACYHCQGNCCCGESGFVWVNQKEMAAMSEFLRINPVDFQKKYLRRANNRFSLKERLAAGDYRCIFFDGQQKRCTIYEVRPDQCRRYPFWVRFKKHRDEVLKECPGVIAKSGKNFKPG